MGRLFTGRKGATIRRSTWHTVWRRACFKTGVEGLHFHDLRDTGNTLAAGTGASFRDPMTRMGHSCARAALIYQHTTSHRDQAIPPSLDELLKRHQGDRPDEASGT